MIPKRIYRSFTHKEAVFRICCDPFEVVTAEIIEQRRILEAYIKEHPAFASSLVPVPLKSGAPESARRMAAAADAVGVGPMAAVAGAMAQLAAEAALHCGCDEAIIENGGDIYLQMVRPVIIGLYSGGSDKLNQLAFEVNPDQTPISICSSSGKMGHSMSLGRCDLATVVAKDAALADAAATQAANLVKTAGQVETALNRIMDIEGIDGVLIIQDGRIGLAGTLPRLVRVP